ncbi:hypothetical protein AAVH_24544 [Aphelenchoides avenae]|nr:hypothetical protein AAVH_24544 [Aphelenchus avenae]
MIIRVPDLERVANSILDVNGIKGQKPWRDRVHAHQTIAQEIFSNIAGKYANGTNPQIAFQVLVYLPYPKDTPGQHCLRSNKTGYFAEGNQKNGVDYFIHYYRNASELNTCLEALWRKIRGNGQEILNAVFSPYTKDMCKEADEKIRGVVASSPDMDCDFPGVAAVRCGYQFVWYQLAYRYFTAGRTAGSSFELSTGDTAYERNCGQIFLFP